MYNGRFDSFCNQDESITFPIMLQISTSSLSSMAQNPSKMVNIQDPLIIENLHHRY